MTGPSDTEAAQRRTAREPVAWRVQSYLDLYEFTESKEIVKDWVESGLDVQPLYAALPPEPAGKRLSDYSDADLQSELHRRALKFLGDPRVCVTVLGQSPVLTAEGGK